MSGSVNAAINFLPERNSMSFAHKNSFFNAFSSKEIFMEPIYSQPAFPLLSTLGQLGFSQLRKNNRGLIITMVVIALLAVSGDAFYSFQTRSTPQKTLQAFCRALEQNDSQGIYKTYSSESNLKDVQAYQQDLMDTIGRITNCTINGVQENGSTATANLTLTLASHLAWGETSVNGYANLVDENGQWKITVAAFPMAL
jgi:hypothetical protein